MCRPQQVINFDNTCTLNEVRKKDENSLSKSSYKKYIYSQKYIHMSEKLT